MLLHRALSLCVVAGYAVVAVHYGLGTSILKLAVPILLAVACIWFPNELGDFTGVVHYRAITAPSPAGLLRAIGWLVLLTAPLIPILLAHGSADD